MDTSQYLNLFIDESKEHLQAINENLLIFENDQQNLGIVNEIFRSAHTLKGMAATMGFEDLTTLTHEMENVLDLVRNQTITVHTDLIDIIFQAVDRLEEIVVSITDGGDGKIDVTEVVQMLKRIANGGESQSSSNESAEQFGAHTLGLEPDYFNDYELTVLHQSIQNGYAIYHIEVELEHRVALKAARAYMVFDTLETFGEIIKSNPSVEDLEEENFDLTFEVNLISKRNAEEIRSAIHRISEIESVSIFSIESEMLTGIQQVATTDVEETVVFAPKQQQENNIINQNNNRRVTTGKTIRVDQDRLEVLMNLFSELVIDRGRLEQIAQEMRNPALTEAVERMNRISGDLQNIILNIRMVPIDQVFNRFPRMIRDLARELNKKVDLQISGAETELDRTVIDEIGDPLVHLLRNAVDHGLESPTERVAMGKAEAGVIQLKAFHSGNHVFIEITDNGKGIDKDKILAKAIERGVITPAEKDLLSEQEIYQLLFSSGFSTAEVVSDVSGRGVGLDVVKSKIESLGGKVTVSSKLGVGTSFSVQLPLTLSIISSMLVQVEGEKYAIPLSSIIETAVFKPSDILLAHKQKVIDFRGKVVPLVDLKEVLDIPIHSKNESDDLFVVVVRKGEKMAGIVVDSLIGQQEIVLKPLGNYLTDIFAISGATILGDGHVALILDPNALIN